LNTLSNDVREFASTPGIGRVYQCGACEGVHLQVGPVSILLTRQAYLGVVEMLNRSASNFELWMEERSCPNTGSPFEEPLTGL
jgi:hypothetical protein